MESAATDFMHRTLSEALFEENMWLLDRVRQLEHACFNGNCSAPETGGRSEWTPAQLRVALARHQSRRSARTRRQTLYGWANIARARIRQTRRAFAAWAAGVRTAVAVSKLRGRFRMASMRRSFQSWMQTLKVREALRGNAKDQALASERQLRLAETLRAHDLETDVLMEQCHRANAEHEAREVATTLCDAQVQVSRLQGELCAQYATQDATESERDQSTRVLERKLQVQCSLNRSLADRDSSTLLPACVSVYDAREAAWTFVGVVPERGEKWAEALYRTLEQQKFFITNMGIEEAVRVLAKQERMPLDRGALVCLLVARCGIDAVGAGQVVALLDRVAGQDICGGVCTAADVQRGMQMGFIDNATNMTLRRGTYRGVSLMQRKVAPGMPRMTVFNDE